MRGFRSVLVSDVDVCVSIGRRRDRLIEFGAWGELSFGILVDSCARVSDSFRVSSIWDLIAIGLFVMDWHGPLDFNVNTSFLAF